MSNLTKIMDEPKSEQKPSGSQTASADSNSVIGNRDVNNGEAGSFSYNIETWSDPGSSQTGSAGTQVPQADLTATGASVICTDKIYDCKIAGHMDLSVSVNRPQVGAGTSDGTLPCSQGRAATMITEPKVEPTDDSMETN